MTAIPCKRPAVPVVDNKGMAATYCRVPGCDWKYGPGVKTDVEQQAAWHRRDHRAAVPTVLTKTLDSGRLVDQCQHCGWVTPEGFTTIDDRKRRVDSHLIEHHGLVSC